MGAPSPIHQVTDTPSPASTGPHDKNLLREDWLLKQAPNHYTVQILGVRDEAALLAFVESVTFPSGLTIAYFETYHRESSWYPLLCGIYPNSQKAQLAIKKLPPEIQQLSPWVRSMASVQSAIRKLKK